MAGHGETFFFLVQKTKIIRVTQIILLARPRYELSLDKENGMKRASGKL